MKHLGDISKINGADIEPVDIITFGSPCQDLSVAGKRAGLRHEANGDEETTRSGLFMEAVRIIKEMREATDGKYPRFALWENVPGAFSSNKGEDFRVVLEELIKIAEPSATMPEVPPFGWAYADSYVGDGWSLAYRVFDTQYWPRTPQRRRRIYLVADFRGQRAREILFERKGLRGHLTESPPPRERVTAYVEVGPGTTDCKSWGLTTKGNGDAFLSEERHTALSTGRGQAGQGYPAAMIAVATQQGGAEVSEDGVCPTITAAAGMSGNNQPWICTPTAYGISSYDSNAMKSENPHSGIYEAETSRTIDLNGGNPACNQGGIAIVEPIAFTQNQRDELRDLGDKAACIQAEPGMKQQTFIIDNIGGQAEYGKESEVNGTLRAGAQGAVVYEWHNQDTRIQGPIDVACTLNTNAGGREGHLVMASAQLASGADVAGCLMASGYDKLGAQEMFSGDYTVIETQLHPVYSMETFHCSTEEEKVQTLKARDWKDPHVVAYGVDCRNMNEYPELYPTLQAKPNGGQSLNFSGAVRDRYIVRRLTPTECARLQGFPDTWGHPDKKDCLSDEEYKFWHEVRNTHAAINGKAVKDYTKAQMEKWYGKLHSDSAEYKMWGNGIALPPSLYCMQGIADALEGGCK